MMAPCQSGSKRTARDFIEYLYKGSIFKDAHMHVPKNMHTGLGEH